MNTPLIARNTLLGAIVGTAPQLASWFSERLTKEFYTVADLNTLMRYELISLSNNTEEIRSWLCDSDDINIWIYHFCKHVVPFIANQLRHVCLSVPDFMTLLAG